MNNPKDNWVGLYKTSTIYALLVVSIVVQALDQFGRIDVLVNQAGYTSRSIE